MLIKENERLTAELASETENSGKIKAELEAEKTEIKSDLNKLN